MRFRNPGLDKKTTFAKRAKYNPLLERFAHVKGGNGPERKATSLTTNNYELRERGFASERGTIFHKFKGRQIEKHGFNSAKTGLGEQRQLRQEIKKAGRSVGERTWGQ